MTTKRRKPKTYKPKKSYKNENVEKAYRSYLYDKKKRRKKR